VARSSNVTGLLAGSALVPLTLDGLSFAAFTLALRAFRINPDLHSFLCHEFDLLEIEVEMWTIQRASVQSSLDHFIRLRQYVRRNRLGRSSWPSDSSPTHVGPVYCGSLSVVQNVFAFPCSSDMAYLCSRVTNRILVLLALAVLRLSPGMKHPRP
jgi:hypothetical protein